MTDLRKAAKEALWAFQYHIDQTWPTDRSTAAIAALSTALAQQDKPKTCTWCQDGDSDSSVYATSCGHYFNLEDGTPEDNKMQWCCYCGKKLVQELITEDDDD